MLFQQKLFHYITLGYANDAAPFLARLALLMSDQSTSDGKNLSLDMNQLPLINYYSRTQGQQGLHEFYAMECLRAILLRDAVTWTAEEHMRLEDIASQFIA